MRRAAFCLREFISCRELKEELHRSELYEVFYADLTSHSRSTNFLDNLDDKMREALMRLVRAHIATRAIVEKRGSTRRGIGQPR